MIAYFWRFTWLCLRRYFNWSNNTDVSAVATGAARTCKLLLHRLHPPPRWFQSHVSIASVMSAFGFFAPDWHDSYQLADQLSQHVRALRGYSLSVSGYHTNGPGFWLSAVYWASCHMFLLCGDRSRSLGSDLDLLMLAFQHGVLKPSAPGMLNPTSFTLQPLYHDARQTMPAVTVKADLLSATGISTQPVKGWKELTLAEHIGPANTNSTVAPPPQATPSRWSRSRPGCGPALSQCGAEIRQRSLLNQTYFGCMC